MCFRKATSLVASRNTCGFSLLLVYLTAPLEGSRALSVTYPRGCDPGSCKSRGRPRKYPASFSRSAGAEASPSPCSSLNALRNQAVNIPGSFSGKVLLLPLGAHHLHLPLRGILRVRLNRVRVVRAPGTPGESVLAGLRRRRHAAGHGVRVEQKNMRTCAHAVRSRLPADSQEHRGSGQRRGGRYPPSPSPAAVQEVQQNLEPPGTAESRGATGSDESGRCRGRTLHAERRAQPTRVAGRCGACPACAHRR